MGTPPKGQADYFSDGDFNAYCSMCGRKRKASTLVKNWQGLYRCPEHDDTRQPQDFVRAVKDDMSVPWAQPLANDDFVFTCSINTQAALPDIGLADCMRADNGVWDPNGV